MDRTEKKRAEIKITEGLHILSQHRLDLRRASEQRKKLLEKGEVLVLSKKEKDKKIASFIERPAVKELFIVSIFSVILFLPRKLLSLLAKLLKSLIFRLKSAYTNTFDFILRKKQSLTQPRALYFDFSPPQSWSKGVLAFIVLAFIFVLPIKVFSSFEELQDQKQDIIEQSLAGYESLKNSDFTSASISFASAKNTIDDLGLIFKNVIGALPGIGETFNFGEGLLMFGENFANAAAKLQEAVAYFDEDIVVVEKIRNLNKKVEEAIPSLLVANRILQALDDNYAILPIDINPFKQALLDSTRALLVFQDFSETFLDILGDKNFKRYLFIFQNNNEIRPTGGFIGSFAIIDIDRGEIKNIEIPGGGSYDIQGQLKELVISPEPFHLINSAWQFQDSNWFPDFPTSAKKIMWFYEKSGGSSVDGVVAVNASLMEDMLRLIGPVEMPEYDRIMTAENFIEETQKIVELEYDKTINKPKQVIADMAPKVLDRLLKINAKDLAQFSEIVHKAILNKDILVFSKNEEAQQELESFGLSGKLKEIGNFTDYLMLVDTNIAGQKTDGKIIKEINHSSEIDTEGNIINTVRITRRHIGVKGELFSGVRNVNYLRLYVPAGSELLSAEGFTAPPGELFESPMNGYVKDKDLEEVQGIVYVDPHSGTRVNNEFGRTVFGNWIMVDPGQEVTVIFRYKLPNKLFIMEEDSGLQEDLMLALGLKNNFINYKMLVEKQPGANNTFFKSYVKTGGVNIVARVGEGVAIQNDSWQYEALLDSDKYYGVVLEN